MTEKPKKSLSLLIVMALCLFVASAVPVVVLAVS